MSFTERETAVEPKVPRGFGPKVYPAARCAWCRGAHKLRVREHKATGLFLCLFCFFKAGS